MKDVIDPGPPTYPPPPISPCCGLSMRDDTAFYSCPCGKQWGSAGVDKPLRLVGDLPPETPKRVYCSLYGSMTIQAVLDNVRVLANDIESGAAGKDAIAEALRDLCEAIAVLRDEDMPYLD